MIKGINRQIIEVTDIGNTYYEKAFLVIKPEYSYYQEKILRKEAKKLIENCGAPHFMRKKAETFGWIIKMCIAASVGAGLTAAFMM